MQKRRVKSTHPTYAHLTLKSTCGLTWNCKGNQTTKEQWNTRIRASSSKGRRRVFVLRRHLYAKNSTRAERVNQVANANQDSVWMGSVWEVRWELPVTSTKTALREPIAPTWTTFRSSRSVLTIGTIWSSVRRISSVKLRTTVGTTLPRTKARAWNGAWKVTVKMMVRRWAGQASQPSQITPRMASIASQAWPLNRAIMKESVSRQTRYALMAKRRSIRISACPTIQTKNVRLCTIKTPVRKDSSKLTAHVLSIKTQKKSLQMFLLNRAKISVIVRQWLALKRLTRQSVQRN